MDWFLGERHKRDKSAGRKRRETKGKRIALEQLVCGAWSGGKCYWSTALRCLLAR
jgi:hypothetical protein